MVPLDSYERRSAAGLLARARAMAAERATRRTIRDVAPDLVPIEVIEAAVAAAASVPSVSNQLPWHFCLIGSRPRSALSMPNAQAANGLRSWHPWAPTGKGLSRDGALADRHFRRAARPRRRRDEAQTLLCQRIGRHRHRPPDRDLRHAGLATLTHTPSPMGFLNPLCHRPAHEKAFLLLLLLLVAGYPASDATTPAAERIKKPLDAVVCRH